MTKQFGRLPEKKILKSVTKKTKLEAISKGTLIWVKAPPYHTKEYLYEVTGSGGKSIRASLYHSPGVRKSWSTEEFTLLMNMGIIRLARGDEVKLCHEDYAVDEINTEQ